MKVSRGTIERDLHKLLWGEDRVRLLSTREAADYLGVTRSTVYRLAVAGKLPVLRPFKYWKFDIKDLDAFIERHKITL